MKLQEFFDTQKQTNITDIEKLDLYQSFLYKKNKKTSLKRSSFVYAKYTVYTMVFVVLMMGMYGVYFINNGTREDNNRFAIKSNTTNTAQADYIAQIIDVKGNFFVEHNGVLETTNNIGNGDTLLLKKDTQLIFEINSGAQSKIIGPAKLIIQKTNTDKYKLNLVYGDFIQVEGTDKKTQTIELAINDIIVKQEDKAQPLNVKFIKNGGNQILQNNGANIVVTKNNGEEKTTKISKEQVVAIQNNDIKVFANIDKFTKAVQEKNISQTFSLTTEETISGAQEEAILLSLLNTPQTIETKEEVTNNIVSILGDEKQILDPTQDEKVSASLYGEFYGPELKEVEGAFIAGDRERFDIAYTKIEKRIQTVYQSFEFTYNKITGEPTEKIEGLKTAIKNIQANITKTYSVPPKYMESLGSIDKTLGKILIQGYGSELSQETNNTPKEDVQK